MFHNGSLLLKGMKRDILRSIVLSLLFFFKLLGNWSVFVFLGKVFQALEKVIWLLT